MAAPIHVIDYLGAIKIESGVEYTSASILVLFPTATVMKLKPLVPADIKKVGVRVGINGGIMFPIIFEDEGYITTGRTFIFDTDCIMAVGIYRVIT